MRNEKRIRIGVIGVGKMGEQHIGNISYLSPDAVLVALHDSNQDRAKKVAALYGFPQVFNDPKELIASPIVDAVLIAAPDNFHADFILACLREKKPVLCEKPLASNLEDAKLVLDTEVELNRRLVSLGFQRRFDPAHMAVKEAALKGVIGRPVLWKGIHRNSHAPYTTNPFFLLTNTAGHDIDSARWLLGSEVKEVYTNALRSRDDCPSDSRDLLLLEMIMNDECLAFAEIYMSADYGYEVSAELVGQLGVLTTAQPDLLIIRAQSKRYMPVAQDWTAPFQGAYAAEINAWIESIAADRIFPGANTWDGYVAIAVAEAANKSLIKRTSYPVELPKQPELYRLNGVRA